MLDTWRLGEKGEEGVTPVTISGSSQGNSSLTALWIEFHLPVNYSFCSLLRVAGEEGKKTGADLLTPF